MSAPASANPSTAPQLSAKPAPVLPPHLLLPFVMLTSLFALWEGLGEDAKLGSAGLIMAIGGGCLMPPLQGWIMDQSFTALSATRVSFSCPFSASW